MIFRIYLILPFYCEKNETSKLYENKARIDELSNFRGASYSESSSSSTKTVTAQSGSNGAGSSYGSASGSSGSGASSYDYERKYEGSYSAGSGSSRASGAAARGSTTSGSSSQGSVAASGWKLLENGTYIRIYDSRTTAKTGTVDSGSSISSAGSRLEGSSSSYDSNWELQPDGSYKRRHGSYSSQSSGSGSGRGASEAVVNFYPQS